MLFPVLGFAQKFDVRDALINRLMLHYQTSGTLLDSQFKPEDKARACYAIGQLEGIKAAVLAGRDHPSAVIIKLSGQSQARVLEKLEAIDSFKNENCEI